MQIHYDAKKFLRKVPKNLTVILKPNEFEKLKKNLINTIPLAAIPLKCKHLVQQCNSQQMLRCCHDAYPAYALHRVGSCQLK